MTTMTEDSKETKVIVPPADQEEPEVNANDAPSSGHEEEISSSQAEKVAAADEVITTGTVNGSDAEILKDKNLAKDAKAEPTGEQQPVDMEPAVREAGVEEVLDTSAQNLHEAVQPLKGMLSGSVVPVEHADGSAVQLAQNKILKARSEAKKGPAGESITWLNANRVKKRILDFVQGKKAA